MVYSEKSPTLICWSFPRSNHYYQFPMCYSKDILCTYKHPFFFTSKGHPTMDTLLCFSCIMPQYILRFFSFLVFVVGISLLLLETT